jgi:hypothetical protein
VQIDNNSKSAGIFMQGMFFSGFLVKLSPGDRWR